MLDGSMTLLLNFLEIKWFREMRRGAKLTEVDFSDSVMCQVGYVKLYFPESPSFYVSG